MKNYNVKLAAFAAFTAITAGTMSILGCAETETAAEATATADTTTSSTSTFSSWLPIILYIAFFVLIGYFLIYRPSKKRKQEEEKLKSSLTLGDKIVTIGGICGTIINIKDDVITIETSMDRTLIEFKNWAIREVIKPVTE